MELWVASYSIKKSIIGTLYELLALHSTAYYQLSATMTFHVSLRLPPGRKILNKIPPDAFQCVLLAAVVQASEPFHSSSTG